MNKILQNESFVYKNKISFKMHKKRLSFYHKSTKTELRLEREREREGEREREKREREKHTKINVKNPFITYRILPCKGRPHVKGEPKNLLSNHGFFSYPPCNGRRVISRQIRFHFKFIIRYWNIC